jgi:predicted RNA-binding Zn ribbon-like protein
MAFGEKGGLKGSIDLLPLDTLASALIQCYSARDNIKQQIYEITGISDIIRGASYASETATAQQIKGQYAGLRLRSMQEEVALFASQLIRLKAQVICGKFQPQTILAYSAASQMQPADQQIIPQALQLIKDKPLRTFRIEVAADSLVQIDEQQMKQERLEFLNTYAAFLSQAMPVGQASPETIPIMMELLKYGIGAFKQARSIEGALDQSLEQMKAAAQQPRPNPEAEKVQMEAQVQQTKMQQESQIEQMKLQHEAQMEQMRQQHEANMKAQELTQKEQFDRWKAELEANTKILAARIAANPGVDIHQLEQNEQILERVMQNVNNSVANAVTQMAAMQSNMADLHKQSTDHINSVVEVMKAPKRIIRGADGRAVGVEPVLSRTIQ